ncbi:MAG: trimethylamine methyltransferase family protein [Eubacteriales bacterium]
MLVNKKDTPGGNFEYLSQDQLHQIYMAALEILERTGCEVHNEEARKLLKDAGAIIDGTRVRYPASLVEWAIKSAPSKITFCGSDGSRKLHLYRNNVYYGLGTDLPYHLDPYSGEIRATVLKDIENIGKVCEYAQNMDFAASLGLASDVPKELFDVEHYIAVRKYCKKPYWTTATDYGNMMAIIDMAAAEAGGYDQLRNNPSIGLYAEPVSPLINEDEALERLMLCAEYGIPVTWASGLIAGATGPVTVAGTIALGTAEGLSGLVIHQLKKPGAPFIFGIAGSIMDMKTSVSCYGGPEFSMIHAVVGQLGRFFDIPSYGTAGCTDSNCLDVQTGMEAMYSNMMAALNGTNLTHDNGYLGAGLIGSLEMILIDSETAGFIKKMQSGIEVNEDTLAVDLINKVGVGGEYVSNPHTFKNFKKEGWYPDYLCRTMHVGWKAAGGKSMQQVVNEKVKQIIEADTKPVQSETIIKVYEEILERRKKEVAEGKFNRRDFK